MVVNTFVVPTGGGVAGVHGRSTDGVHGWPVLYDSGGQDGLPAVLLIRLH